MSKKWSQYEARNGNTVAPDAVNEELRAQSSSITTLDRAQLPVASFDNTNLKDYALHRVYAYPRAPLAAGLEGEQRAVVDTDTSNNSWNAVTFQAYSGGWLSVFSFTLTGFKNGHLFIEWSGNAFAQLLFTNTKSNLRPGNPKYVNVRILVAGTVIAERQGAAYHEHWRIFGTSLLPTGDHQVELQFKLTPPGTDDAMVDDSANHMLQAHIYSSKCLAIGRWC